MRVLLQLALVAGAAWSATAQADCKDHLDEVQEQARKLEVDDEFRQQLRQLHRSAILLAENDKGDLCDEVAETMEEMVNKRERLLDKQARLEALRHAPPITRLNRVMAVDALVDSTVYDPDGEELGTLTAVTVNAATGQVGYAVLRYGGFLGFGEKLIPIPFDRLRLAQQRGVLVLDIPRETLDEAQGIEPDPWPLHPPMPGQTTAAE